MANEIVSAISQMDPGDRTQGEQELLDAVKQIGDKAASQITLLKQANELASRQQTMQSRMNLQNTQIDMERDGDTLSQFSWAQSLEPRTQLDKDMQTRSSMDMIGLLEPLFGPSEDLQK